MSRMRRALPISLLVIALTSTADSQATGDARQAISCASLAGLKLDNTTITGAIPVPAGSRDVSHCRVLGRIDKEITFTALLPDPWNGSFFRRRRRRIRRHVREPGAGQPQSRLRDGGERSPIMPIRSRDAAGVHGRSARGVVRDVCAACGRPLCPHPQRAVYDGKGNLNEAGSYRCR
jgi:hypothetical protein